MGDPVKYLGSEINSIELKLQPVRVGNVERTKRSLNKSKSPSADSIPIKILKYAINLVSKPLTLIYNASLEAHICKLAKVTPNYRTGSKTDVNNYRPISVLSAVSRILETIVHEQVMEYLIGYNRLYLNQLVFQKLHKYNDKSIESYRP